MMGRSLALTRGPKLGQTTRFSKAETVRLSITASVNIIVGSLWESKPYMCGVVRLLRYENLL